MGISLAEHREGVTKTVIAKFSDSNKPKAGLSAFFPSVTTTAKMVSIEVRRNGRKIAVDVARCTDPVRNLFSRSTEKLFVPPFFSESFDFTACEAYDRTFGNGNDLNKYDAASLATEAYENITELENKIRRAILKQYADVLQTGIVTVKNGDSIDFKRKAASMVTLAGTAKWDATATANPMADFVTGMEFLRTVGLSSGTTVNAIFGANALANFLSNAKVIAQADFRNIKRIDVGMPIFDNTTGLIYHGQIAAGDFMINIWTYNDSYEDANGVDQKYIDTNNVILVPDDFVGKTAFAGIPTVFGDPISGQVIKPKKGEFVLHDVIDQVKKTWQLILESAPVAIPVSVDRIYTIKTA